MVIAAVLALGGGTLVSPPVRRFLSLLAPGSGDLWQNLGPPPSGPIDSPYGSAEVAFDSEGVPHISADDELALQFAHGFVQGYDRLFQMDLYRRQLRGRLSEVVGPVTLDTDEFHVRFGFGDAAIASRQAIEGTETETVMEAYVDGVNHARDLVTSTLEEELLDYRIEPWTATDTLLLEKLLGWQLTGSFRALRRRALVEAFGEDLVTDLLPARYDHDVPILQGGAVSEHLPPRFDQEVPKRTVDWLSSFEPPPGQGSNSWVVRGDRTASGGPVIANDPHLTLAAPPIWYEVGLDTPTFATRGVTIPGTPFVVIGRNRSAAWGFTNPPADVLDFYTYEVEDEQYRIGDDWFDFEQIERTIDVSGAPNHTFTVRRTVHGPMIDRHGSEVAAQWTGHGATRTIQSVRQFQFAESLDDFRTALELWDLPPQNLVYADRDGRTMYHLIGKIPIRRTDGELVRGDRVFDGSAREGAWEGFDPFGHPSWEGFIPFDELPHAIDEPVVATANQRILDDPPYYLAPIHAEPYRAKRLSDRLELATDDGQMDLDEHVAIQQDIVDTLALDLSDEIVDTVEPTSTDEEEALDGLDTWEGSMSTDSFAALVFTHWLSAFRELVFGDAFVAEGFGQSYWPSDWVLANLPPDHDWFDRVGARSDLIKEAFEVALDRVGDDSTLGDVQQTELDHPLEVGFLGYPRHPMPGSPYTLKNYRRSSTVGPGWQMIVDPDADVALGRLAGGNAGRLFSPHYADQFDDWVEGSYKSIDWEPTVERTLNFRGGSS